MDVFELNRRLIHDYSSYICSFIQIRDERIGKYTQECLDNGLLWPEPLIQLNPSFQPGKWIDELVESGILHQECSRIFRINKDQQEEGQTLRLHKHQVDAIDAARAGDNYVLTTGTGSGKSLAYIVPIVDYVLRHGSGRGIQAIVIYPMNALANSQYGELEKFLHFGYPEGQSPVTFEKYTGQESEEQKKQIIENPPDILLTNYVMLELILTRIKDKNLIRSAQNLRFLVLDELHTYRGRQGADVAMLIRRLRNYCGGENLQCIGTSATLAGGGTYDQQRAEVAQVATLFFGSQVHPERVVMETLQRATPDKDLKDPIFKHELIESVQNPKPVANYRELIEDPLSIWVETTFGITKEPGSGRLIRSIPKSISGDEGAAKNLSRLTGLSEGQCTQAIQERLLMGYRCKHPETGFPTFAFRLHQFISRGNTVYTSLQNEEDRYITIHGQQYVPNDRNRVLFPLAFCRECGQEYYSVYVITDQNTGMSVFVPRDPNENYSSEEEGKAGYLYHNSTDSWPDDELDVIKRVPDNWVENRRGISIIRSNHVKDLPRPVNIKPNGSESGEGLEFYYISAPFRFCLHCGVSYGSRQSSDFAKLATLGSEGRSTATTILSLSAINHLQKDENLPQKAKKLLSFTDNRQDASLQAGHFNDFVEIGLLRTSLYQAVCAAGEEGLRHDELTQKVFNSLVLPLEFYAVDPNVRFQALADTQRALRNVLGYRLYQDLKRGWRITSPNLEQCGLLEIQYASLDEVCEVEDLWQDCHPTLVVASPETRKKICKVLLDYMRRELAIKVDYLNREFQERIIQQSNQHLKSPWAIDENERLEHAAVLYPRSRSKKDFLGNVYLSERGGFGQYLRRPTTFPGYLEKITLEQTAAIISQILTALRVGGLVEVVDENRNNDDVPGYQLTASAMIWVAGDGSKAFHDPIRVPNESELGSRTNPFFVEFYKSLASGARGIEAREHTAQVPYELRISREENFREGRLPILYCSPTMELGVDISQLNVVNMRNIPPTPANYAQRSGRAGRSGQPALVFSYCSTGSPHDQYFFKRPQLMVAGAVSPPRVNGQ
ncbi:DEAD/DEAH box helicase [Pelotomaculum terephthalicicum JT]|uniref:DEAD/DEAH box helicase n=1 Tax=Pelotomaculum terephthalicicum TaxID=206393 RepID=UPI001F039A45|nr:DEAD/DEAH box helicase [Pelotomaculum terephthalicicum]MCG9969917.1 DEAD/DEAH box helicase [Pelotomaculum terephthalicicum JT]